MSKAAIRHWDTDQGRAELAKLPQRDPSNELYEATEGRWLTTSVAHEDDRWDRLSAT